MIPLPRIWWLASAMLAGVAVGFVSGVAATLVVHARIRPDLVIALTLGVPTAIGLLLIMFSGRRWVTALGAFILSVAPGWFGVLLVIQAVSGA